MKDCHLDLEQKMININKDDTFDCRNILADEALIVGIRDSIEEKEWIEIG